MSIGKCVSKKINSKKEIFALCSMNDGTWKVLKLCENYDGKVRGGIRKTWRYVKKDLTEGEARELFLKKVN